MFASPVHFGAHTAAATRNAPQPIAMATPCGIVAAFGMMLILYAMKKGPMVLYAEHRPLLGKVRSGRVWAFPLGMAFAAGWTPCIGPILAGILAIARRWRVNTEKGTRERPPNVAQMLRAYWALSASEKTFAELSRSFLSPA